MTWDNARSAKPFPMHVLVTGGSLGNCFLLREKYVTWSTRFNQIMCPGSLKSMKDVMSGG